MGASWLIKITKNNEKYALTVVRIFVCFVYFVVKIIQTMILCCDYFVSFVRFVV